MTARDLKEALGSGRKPDISHSRKATDIYSSRAAEWGEFRYERSNFLRPASDAEPGTPAAVRADFKRLRAYLTAAKRHLGDVLDAMELHQALDSALEDVDGMKRAAYAVDDDPDPKTGIASGLPHLCGLAASVNMAIAQATTYGLLPKDPGQPWMAEVRRREQAAQSGVITVRMKPEYASQIKEGDAVFAHMIEPPVERRTGGAPAPDNDPPGDPASCTRARCKIMRVCLFKPCASTGKEPEPPKVQIDISDPETRAIWETAKRAQDEVASWPAWKRGESEPSAAGDRPVPVTLEVAPCNEHGLDCPDSPECKFDVSDVLAPEPVPNCKKHPDRYWCATCDVPVDINPAGRITCRRTNRELV